MANLFKNSRFPSTCFYLHNAKQESENLNQPSATFSSAGENLEKNKQPPSCNEGKI
jgi:hypothetical protein